MDRLERVKKEIERRIEEYKAMKIDSSYYEGMVNALVFLRDEFIIPMQEKHIEDKDLIGELQALMFEWSNKKDNMGTCIKRHLPKIISCINSMQEEPRPKFKVGDTIANGEDTLTIEQVMEGYYIVYNENTENDANQVIWELKFEDQDNWKLIRKPVREELTVVATREALAYANELSKEVNSPWDITDIVKAYEYGMIAGAEWQKEQFENNRLKHCNSITNEQAELEQGFIDQHLDKNKRMPTFLDAIEYGMQWQKNKMMEDAIKCEITWMDGFMLNYTQEQQDDLLEKIGAKVGDKVKLVIIKED